MEKPKFLSEKYPDLPGSKPVERAVQKRLREEGHGPATKEARVEAYMDRLENLTEDERGFELLKRKVLDRFAINTRDEEALTKIADGLYESEKRIAIEQGRGGDIQQFASTRDIVEHYKPLIREKEEIQRKTLSAWLDYLQENDAMQPAWFRYLVVRSLEKMGSLDKEKVAYGKRGATTIAPFPELNSEALGWVYKRVDENKAPEDLSEEKREEVEKLIKAKDFGKLYAFAQIETAGQLNRESLEGEWRKYEQGSDFHTLENDLHSKGTGWCTAEGSAQSQLEGGDFYVYYTKSARGYTEPRVAIRMEGDRVGEVRGVNQRQELEPELVDIAQNKYQALPGGESYDKKAHDMKEVTRLTKKQEKAEPFTKADLEFLYELEAPIEGFGYDKDPRVAELRDTRDTSTDLSILFDCAPADIARSVAEIRNNTKAYVGKLEPGIFEALPQTLEHIYTKFPEEPVKFRNIELGTGVKDGAAFKKAIEVESMKVSRYAESVLNSSAFTVMGERSNAELVEVSVAELGFDSYTRYDTICARAKELGLELCPAEVGPQLRLQYKDQPLGEYVVVAMNAISGADGDPDVFVVARIGDGCWLGTSDGRPGGEWSPERRFVFLRPRK